MESIGSDLYSILFQVEYDRAFKTYQASPAYQAYLQAKTRGQFYLQHFEFRYYVSMYPTQYICIQSLYPTQYICIPVLYPCIPVSLCLVSLYPSIPVFLYPCILVILYTCNLVSLYPCICRSPCYRGSAGAASSEPKPRREGY